MAKDKFQLGALAGAHGKGGHLAIPANRQSPIANCQLNFMANVKRSDSLNYALTHNRCHLTVESCRVERCWQWRVGVRKYKTVIGENASGWPRCKLRKCPSENASHAFIMHNGRKVFP